MPTTNEKLVTTLAIVLQPAFVGDCFNFKRFIIDSCHKKGRKFYSDPFFSRYHSALLSVAPKQASLLLNKESSVCFGSPVAILKILTSVY